VIEERKNIFVERERIKNIQEQILEISKEKKEDDMIGEKIMFLEEVLMGDNFKISKVLESLSGNIPKNIQVISLDYYENEIRLSGIYTGEEELGESIYVFEDNLKKSKKYKKVVLNYLRKKEKNYEFQMVLTL
jgi:Tfp pilus assembly protein PilN